MLCRGMLVLSASHQLRLVSISLSTVGSWVIYCCIVLASAIGLSVCIAFVLLNMIRIDFLCTGGSGRCAYEGVGSVVVIGVVVVFWVGHVVETGEALL
jgi:hypothetical protein